MQKLETGAECDGLRSKLQELATASGCRFSEVDEFEGVQVVALWHDLTQRPLLQAVLVPVAIDCEALKALHSVNGVAKVVKYRVDHLGRCALEVTTDENVCRGEQFFALCTALKGVRIILTEAFVDLHIV